jgi:hypothetical protein
MKRLVDVFSVCLLLAAGALLAGDRIGIGAPRPTDSDFVGLRLPALHLQDGSSIKLTDGTLRLVFFFRTTCPACEAMRPKWRRLVGESQLPSIGVTWESGVPDDYLPSGSELAIVNLQEIRALLSIQAVPTTLVIDGEGVIRSSIVGNVGEEAISGVLSAILEIRKEESS